ncbi:MAG: hypothetical protein A2589_01615 [Candidatus Vogelbacteria bacterium RIFOXYD1_FULL_46_19]|uniref:Type II secretion system protein n=1 Tax=Candidatus Vogelbacteria bacterium RIFOXYD1_FULL_46_19 TaxID=1802439 RepID=A0A1G2QHT0_9BACT|nr:MAG: hypothetical protein A2589_01615 [Candidatus Vogelbacteria bacterium RIFOXYD1_FULL_46_19]
MIRKPSPAGFSLIELLIYFSILTILLLAAGGALFNVIEGKVRADNQQEITSNARLALEVMTEAIRQATEINSPDSGGESSILSLQSIALNDVVTFDVVAGVLRIKEGTTTAVPITSGGLEVTNLTFTNTSFSDAPSTIRINLTLKTRTDSARQEYGRTHNFLTTVTSRYND